MRDRRPLWPGLLWVAVTLLLPLSALLATRAADAQPIIPEAPAGSLGVCDSGNPYPRAKIATEANAGDCNADTAGAGTEQVLCICMPDGAGGYSWEAVAADNGTDDQTAAEVPITDTGAFFAGADVEAALQEVGPTMTDARAPTAHASTHEAGGVDEIAVGAATSIDVDGDGVDEVSAAGASVVIDGDDDGTPEVVVDGAYLIVRQDGGVAGTDEVRISHDGADANIRSQSGRLIFRDGTGATFLYLAAADIVFGANMRSNLANGPMVRNQAASAADPTLIPFRTDTDTGVGGDGANMVALVAGNATALKAAHDGTDTRVTAMDMLRTEPRATAPASCTLGDTYMDTSGALCGCNASAAWEIIHDLSSGGAPNCT